MCAMVSMGFSQRNITIAALSLAVGIGFTQMGDIFAIFPELVQSVFRRKAPCPWGCGAARRP